MDPLDRLADRVGIEAGYRDNWQNHVATSTESKTAILTAMGLAAADAGQRAATLEALESRPWRRLVEPVAVIAAEAQPATLTVTVPETLADRRLAWAITEEGGNRRRSVEPIAALRVSETRDEADGRRQRRLLTLPGGLPDGYHRLRVGVEGVSDQAAECLLIVAPRRCWSPDDIAPGDKMWGVSCQLYALRSAGGWGVGNFSDLTRLAELAAAQGADVVGLNPLHALFPADPGQCSPYSPASRDFLNILYIDVEAVPDFAEAPEARAMVSQRMFRRRLAAARDAETVDYPAVTALVLPVLEALYQGFRARHLASPTARGRAFRDFRAGHGDALRGFATFMALHQRLAADDPAMLYWRDWPEGYRRPDSPAVAAFVAAHPQRVEFHEYLQWIADEQLQAAAARAQGAGMRIGLYRDLAVGVGPGSAAAWADGDALLSGISVGCPPDLLARLGQNWGLAPFDPLALYERAYAPFIAALRANMRHAGALRIDHAMGLMHLYWVPRGLATDQGAYVSYPFQALLRILALESRRNRCLVIGEDLGTIPDDFSPAVADAGVLSYRVLFFERIVDGPFARPSTYPEAALVTGSTHDLPTLAGFWAGRDLEWRRLLSLYPDDAVRDADAAGRIADRRRLIDALIDAGLWPPDPPTDSEALAYGPDLRVAIQRFLARTPTRLFMVQLEDALGQIEQMNLPGTVDGHPNWRRKLALTVDRIFHDGDVGTVLQVIRDERSMQT